MKTQILPPPIARLLLAILMCLPICGSHAFAQEAESYAVFTKATNTLRFKHDTNKPNRAFALNDGENAPGWYDKLNVNTIEKVIFDASFANARPTSCYKWFDGCKNLTTIDGIEYLNTENVTNMSGMFRDCSALTTLNVSNFDTKNVTNMSGMFRDCSALTTLNVSNFDTKNVTSMSEMFYGCYALTTLDVSHFDTKNVTDMSGMFSYCRALRTLDVSNFDTKNVTIMSRMFSNSSALRTLDLSNFNTKNVTDTNNMFSFCEALTTLDVSNFDTKNVTDMNNMFYKCSKLTTLDVSSFDTKNVTNMSWMFCSCKALSTLDVSSFDTKNVTDMSLMFDGCSALTTLDVSNFDTSNVTTMRYMFSGCSALRTLNVSNFDTKNVTDMSGMFAYNPALRIISASEKFVTTACKKDEDMFKDCTNLVGSVPYDKNKVGKEMANYTTGYFKYKDSIFASFYAVFDEATSTLTFKHDNNRPIEAFVLNEGSKFPGWYKYHDDISKVVFDTSFANARPTSCYRWFQNCNDLTTIEGIEYLNTQNVTNMGFMFNGCSALRTLDLSSFDTKNVTNMEYMFKGCSALNTLNLSSFDTKNVTNMEYMFKGCSALNTLNLSSFDTQNMTNIQSMFKGCSALTTLDVSNFDTKNVTNMSEMFSSCFGLTTIYASDKFVTTACEFYRDMFAGCTNLVGAVPYDRNKVGKEMANYTTGYFTYKAPTGIEAPTVSDDTTAEYYDLQGRRLNAPQKGVNIVKRGKKTTKVLVK
ncbi:BspA family leucine-rich repeat surface protein [Leyella stercorea]|uniref:BspA family leucine-rich repeat surface protein n=2 Tax=Leyella stercorea TaxID=363265 RepID=UPI003AF05840